MDEPVQYLNPSLEYPGHLPRHIPAHPTACHHLRAQKGYHGYLPMLLSTQHLKLTPAFERI